MSTACCLALRVLPFATLPPLLCALSLGADSKPSTPTSYQADWGTKTASCPAKVTQSTNIVYHVTGINDLVIDFKTGESLIYQLRVKSSPLPSVPENPFGITQSGLAPTSCTDSDGNQLTDATLRRQLDAIRNIDDKSITPPSPGGDEIPLEQTLNAIRNHREVTAVLGEQSNPACSTVFQPYQNDSVIQWLLRIGGSHSKDFNVSLEPNKEYAFELQELWKRKQTKGSKMSWGCNEADIITLSLGPLFSELPTPSYDHQKVPDSSGNTTDQLVVNGNSFSVLGAALVNFGLPIPKIPTWTGLDFSVGPVYTLSGSPGVSKLGVFVGGSLHLYKQIFITPGVHIGQFADFPAGFHAGSVIPPNFGNLTPVTRTSARFAVGVTIRTTTFKKSTQTTGAATKNAATSPTAPSQNTVTNPNTGGGNQGQPQNPVNSPNPGNTVNPPNPQTPVKPRDSSNSGPQLPNALGNADKQYSQTDEM